MTLVPIAIYELQDFYKQFTKIYDYNKTIYDLKKTRESSSISSDQEDGLIEWAYLKKEGERWVLPTSEPSFSMFDLPYLIRNMDIFIGFDFKNNHWGLGASVNFDVTSLYQEERKYLFGLMKRKILVKDPFSYLENLLPNELERSNIRPKTVYSRGRKLEEYMILIGHVDHKTDTAPFAYLTGQKGYSSFKEKMYNFVKVLERVICILNRPPFVDSGGLEEKLLVLKHTFSEWNKKDVVRVEGSNVEREVRRVVKGIDLQNRTSLIKVGGSMNDLTANSGTEYNNLLGEIARLSKAGNPMILTVGLGRRGDIVKDGLEQGRYTTTGYQNSALKSLEDHAQEVAQYLSNQGVKAEVTENFGAIDDKYLSECLPVIIKAPYHLDLSIQDSDAQTVGIAEFFGIEKVIFAKDTEGVYLQDPNLNKDREQNPLVKGILAKEMLDGTIAGKTVQREGSDGRDEHLIENSALKYLIDRCQNVKVIHVVDGKNTLAIASAVKGDEPIPVHGSIIYKDETLIPPTMKEKMWERKLF